MCKLARTIPLITALIFFTGCSTYSKKQCESFDWKEEGRKAALAGEKISERASHFHATCEKEQNVSLDKEQFIAGYKVGLKLFCNRETGLKHGANGGKYAGICPKTEENDFLVGYNSGQLSYLQKEVEVLRSEVQSLRSQVYTKDGEISKLKSEIETLKR